MKIGAHSILVEREAAQKEQVTSTGIIIPGTIKKNKVRGTVITAGTGTAGKPMEVKKGDTVTYESLVAIEIELDGKPFDIIDTDHCLWIDQEATEFSRIESGL